MQTIVTYDETIMDNELRAERITKDDVFVIHRNNEFETDLQFHKSLTDLSEVKQELASMTYDESHPVVSLYHLRRRNIAQLIIDSYRCKYDAIHKQYVLAN